MQSSVTHLKQEILASNDKITMVSAEKAALVTSLNSMKTSNEKLGLENQQAEADWKQKMANLTSTVSNHLLSLDSSKV